MDCSGERRHGILGEGFGSCRMRRGGRMTRCRSDVVMSSGLGLGSTHLGFLEQVLIFGVCSIRKIEKITYQVP